MLQMAIFGSGLMFLGLMASYLKLERPNAGFDKIEIPQIFWASTLLIMISSLTLHLANMNFKQDKYLNYRILMGITLSLGLIFIGMQLWGWQELFTQNNSPEARTARGFIYMLSGLHIVHIVVGLFFLIKIFVEAIKRISYLESFIYSVNPPNQLKINLIIFYWHFVDILWILLFAFLLWRN
ncbi:cytochrome c oxidase subunit 3 [Arcicella aurantiaca]|uniref:Cytochrome c oxidase subunit 3 n=2 Tax=Arcicella aurantiaca TaxID=591202 RepID=A0A316ECR3_9BACT|nr:cytochrome c oxidase subunit 3 [Arcicella aurantiaca]